MHFLCLGREFLIVTENCCLLRFTFKGAFSCITWLSMFSNQWVLAEENEPEPESFAFFESWNPIFDRWNCTDLEICGDNWSPSIHRIWVWIVENIISLHFLMNDFCKSFHIFSLLRFHSKFHLKISLKKSEMKSWNLCLARCNHCINTIKWFVALSFKTHDFENRHKCSNIMWWSLK